MKQFFTLFLSLAGLYASAQIKTFSPTGTRVSNSTQMTINTITETAIYVDSIPGGNLVNGKFVQVRIDLAVTTPAVNLSTLTLRIKYGNQSIITTSNVILSGGLTGSPVTLVVFLVSRGTNNQFVSTVVNQSAASIFNLTSGNSIMRGAMTIDSSITQPLIVTAQIGGTLGTTSVVRDWAVRYDL